MEKRRNTQKVETWIGYQGGARAIAQTGSAGVRKLKAG